MAESFNMPVSMDQLTHVVNSLVEVSMPNTSLMSTSAIPIMSAAEVGAAAAGGVGSAGHGDGGSGEDVDDGHTCFTSQILQTQPPGFQIPVSLAGQTVSVVPLMLSLNLANRSLLSTVDRNSIDRAFLPTGVVNDKINSIVYSCAGSSTLPPLSAPTPISFPSVTTSVIHREIENCPTITDIDTLDCVQTTQSGDLQHDSTVAYSSSTNQETVQNPNINSNHANALIAATVQGSLPNSTLVGPDLSSLTDLRLGIGVVSQHDAFSSIHDTLSPLLQVANHYNQAQTQNEKNGSPAVECIVQSAGPTLELTNSSAGMEASMSVGSLQPLINHHHEQQHYHHHHHHHQQQHQNSSELANSLGSLGMITEKESQGNNLVNSATVLDVANMSVIDMILKVQQSDVIEAKDMDSGELTTVKPEMDPASITDSKECPQLMVDNFCLDCNANTRDPCQIHNSEYSDIQDSPLISRARISLPSLLYLKNTSAHGYTDALGVWTKGAIPRKTRFGPLTAKMKGKCPVNAEKTTDFPIWMIFFAEESTADVLDVSDENECNWMMFVKPARTMAEQTLVAYQQHTSIYFITCCDLQPHQELLVWYSKDYAKALGVPIKADLAMCCSVCSKIFASHKLLAQHLKTIHSDVSVRRWRCQFCTRGFTSTTKLKTHLLTHIGVKPHSCVQCGKQFTDQSNLRMHQSIHTGERKFSCCICNKQFRQKAHLNSHMFTHTGEKNLKCQFCDKRFSRSSDLKQHEYQHTKEKIFCCSHCDKSFYKMQNFKKHLKIHSGERKYTCIKCVKSFFTKYHLKRHSGTCKGSKSVAGRGAAVLLSEDVDIALNAATDIVDDSVFKDEVDRVDTGGKSLSDIDLNEDQ